MNAQTKARLIAAIALPMLLLNIAPAYAAAQPAAATRTDAVATQLEHISIVTAGPANGAPIFLIPGLASPRAVWDGVAPELAKTHRVYLVQVNGFAGDDPRGNLKPGVIDGIVSDLAGYITASKLKGAKIVGHSLGGLVALKFAQAHPADVANIMVVDSLPYVGVIFAPTATVATMEPTAKAIAAQMAASYGKPANMAAQEANAARLALKPGAVKQVAEWGAKADPRVVAQAFYEDMTMDLRTEVGTIKTPITLLYPWSAAVPKPVADALYRDAYKPAPNVTYIDVPDSAHFIMLDQPAAFAAALKTFAATR